MNYRQWKKNYKKRHGVNPPLSVDKRKQYKLARNGIKALAKIDWLKITNTICETILDTYATIFHTVGSTFQNIADYFRQK